MHEEAVSGTRPGDRLKRARGRCEHPLERLPCSVRTRPRSGPRGVQATVSRVDDRAIVERQIGRRPRAFGRVAARCSFGLPAVTEQEPYDENGVPFPTMYYLTCRHLVAAVSRLEAAGGVERWSAAVAASSDLTADLDNATTSQRRLRHALAAGHRGADQGASLDSGIGGSRNPTQLKCLHAHVAFALAHPGYGVGELILAEVPERWPTGRCCSHGDDGA